MTLFGNKTNDAIFEKVRYLTCIKSGIKYVISHYFPKMKVDSYDSLPIEKNIDLAWYLILIKSVIYKDKNHYFYKMFLVKCSYQLAKK